MAARSSDFDEALDGYYWRHRHVGFGSGPENLFSISTSFKKEIPLPHLSNWDGINESFMLASDRLLVFVKKRGLLWSTFSEPQMKPIYMTTDRHLLVYTQLNQGYLLDMREAYSIVVWMKATKRNNGTSYRLSQIKLKFAFGTLYFWVPSHLHVPLGVKWRHILQMTFRGECESWPTQEGQHSSLNLKEAKGALLSLPPTSKKEVSDISRTPRPSRSPKVSSETAIEVLDEESTAISEYCASELRINGKIELTHEEEAAERNYFDAATAIPSFSRLERVRRFLKPNRFLVVKRSASTPLFLPSTCTSLETISEVDSSNSGFFSDVTNTEDVSCRANPNVTVAQMREQLETHSKRNPRTGLFGRFMPRSPKKTGENFSPKKLLVDQSKLDPSETMA
ncbi:unnamed protein product, partial [Mesorhabditis belari]|uniref:DUF7778 domain-containing protein n=1 Tax=Mesorhabditis belari TaxID=2138241 RepID=A0AAF3EJY6_9BILA